MTAKDLLVELQESWGYKEDAPCLLDFTVQRLADGGVFVIAWMDREDIGYSKEVADYILNEIVPLGIRANVAIKSDSIVREDGEEEALYIFHEDEWQLFWMTYDAERDRWCVDEMGISCSADSLCISEVPQSMSPIHPEEVTCLFPKELVNGNTN